MMRIPAVVLYQLKRDYGGPLDVYQQLSVSASPVTGRRTADVRATHVERANKLPATWTRTRWTTAAVDTDVGEFLIDKRDFADQLTSDDWIVWSHRKFQVSKTEDNPAGWIVTTKESIGETP